MDGASTKCGPTEEWAEDKICLRSTWRTLVGRTEPLEQKSNHRWTLRATATIAVGVRVELSMRSRVFCLVLVFMLPIKRQPEMRPGTSGQNGMTVPIHFTDPEADEPTIAPGPEFWTQPSIDRAQWNEVLDAWAVGAAPIRRQPDDTERQCHEGPAASSHTGPITWCTLCGAYSSNRSFALRQSCPGSCPSDTSLQRLRQLVRGRHPITGAWLLDAPQPL